MRISIIPVVAALVSIGLLPSYAEADDAGPVKSILVVEGHVGDTVDGDAGLWARDLAREILSLGTYRVLDRTEALQIIGRKWITPASRAQQAGIARIEKQLQEGDDLLYQDPKAAIEVLTRARTELEGISEGLAAQVRLREEFLRTQMLLARSNLDAGNEEKALEVLREVVRVYGDNLDVTAKTYHPRIVSMFQKARRQMSSQRTTALTVEAGDAKGCVTLLNGRVLDGAPPREYKGIHPGMHYAQVRCAGRESMIHKIDLGLLPRRETFDIEFEAALRAGDQHLGFVFRDAATADRQLPVFAAELGRMLGADHVVVVSLVPDGNRVMVTAKMVDVLVSGITRAPEVEGRAGLVSASGVRFLAESLSGTGDARVVSAPVRGQGTATGGSWKQNYGAWAVSGIGVAALVAGAVEGGLYFKYRSDATKPYDYASSRDLRDQFDDRVASADKANIARIVGPVLLGVGAAALVGGIVWFVVADDGGDKQTATTPPVFVPIAFEGGGGIGASFSF